MTDCLECQEITNIKGKLAVISARFAAATGWQDWIPDAAIEYVELQSRLRELGGGMTKRYLGYEERNGD